MRAGEVAEYAVPRAPEHGLLWRRRHTEQTRQPLQVTTFSCAALADADAQGLGFTYWFDTETKGPPYPVAIRFTGRRIFKGKPGPRDTFDVVESIERVVPGSGPVAITARVFDVTPGEWNVTATQTTAIDRRGSAKRSPSILRSRLPRASSIATTGFAPAIRVRAPGARLAAWPSLVGAGVVVALATQAELARHTGLPSTRVLLVSLLASVVGLVTAKLYFLAEHRGEHERALSAGLCIQGFVLGGIAALVVGALLGDVPAGPVLDVSTPGLLFGMTVGRFGCFFGGCCAGRPTASRWGLWSSDRRLGVRRIPTQLLESAVALAIGLVALPIVWFTTPLPAGSVFIVAIASYTLSRQLLFPLRDQPRHTTYGRTLAISLAAAVISIDLAIAILT